MEKTFLITVTYNASSFIEAYLSSVKSILESTEGVYLIIVDNNSSDETVSLVSSFVNQNSLELRITLIASDLNLGFGSGCNLGANRAVELGANYLWFLNPDTEARYEALHGLTLALSESAEVDFVGSILMDANGAKRSSAFNFPTIARIFTSASRTNLLGFLRQNTPTLPIPKTLLQVDWTTGASFAAKASSFCRLRGFDEDYFLYFEEVDLFYRANKLGMKVFVDPRSVVYHESGASTKINTKSDTPPKAKPDYWYESRRTFYLKNYGSTYFMLIDVAFGIACVIERLKARQRGTTSLHPPKTLTKILKYSIVGSMFR